MVKVLFFIKMEINSQDFGKKTLNMVKEYNLGIMAIFIMEIMKMELEMALEYYNNKMDINMKDFGKMGNNLADVNLCTIMTKK